MAFMLAELKRTDLLKGFLTQVTDPEKSAEVRARLEQAKITFS
jgi:hypothetical protein